MAGTTGPVPKRSDQRRRRNKDGGEITAATSGTFVPPAAPPALDWHPLAREWYESLSRSGQSVFYEPSDWAQARVWAEVLSRQMNSGARVSANMISAWSAGATELLTTEGARRRSRLELERAGAGAVDVDEQAAAVIDAYRERLAG